MNKKTTEDKKEKFDARSISRPKISSYIFGVEIMSIEKRKSSNLNTLLNIVTEITKMDKDFDLRFETPKKVKLIIVRYGRIERFIQMTKEEYENFEGNDETQNKN